jgi:dihydroorotase
MTTTLNSPLDMHLHLRDDKMLQTVAPLSAKSFSAAIIMPNLVPPITDLSMLRAYKKRIIEAINDENFTPLMTLFFKDSYDLEFLKEAKDDIAGIKLYPAGITTNSEAGVSGIDSESLKMTLNAMSKLKIPLLIHGESNGFVMDRESEFVPVYEELAKNFPDLVIIMEHITTKESVEALKRHKNLYATITLHHLLITLDDVAGGMLEPHLFCKPIAKRPQDRDALLEIALNGNEKVMFGSDSAPHPQSAKESCGCAAGVFTAPIALQALVELFEKHDKLDNLQAFISDNAQKIYNFTPNQKSVTLEKTPFKVPSKYGEVVPMYAQKEIKWSIKSIS